MFPVFGCISLRRELREKFQRRLKAGAIEHTDSILCLPLFFFFSSLFPFTLIVFNKKNDRGDVISIAPFCEATANFNRRTRRNETTEKRTRSGRDVLRIWMYLTYSLSRVSTCMLPASLLSVDVNVDVVGWILLLSRVRSSRITRPKIEFKLERVFCYLSRTLTKKVQKIIARHIAMIFEDPQTRILSLCNRSIH